MDTTTVVSASFLCVFNVAFMIAGIFLNSVVIISLRRSSQLRKKLCYFMIFVLSCFDLGVVAIIHPIHISSTIPVLLGTYNDMQEHVRWNISSALTAFSMFALFVLNIERVVALIYPFVHHTSVTKRRLIFLLVTMMILFVFVLSLPYFNNKISLVLLSVICIPMFWLVLFYLNYKMFILARSKRDDKKVATLCNQERKRPMFQFKKFSTCLLTVICYFVCSCPQLVYSALRLTSNRNIPVQELLLFNLWTSSLVCMNSTLNCLIFFWRNSILRREGMNTVKAIFCQDCMV